MDQHDDDNRAGGEVLDLVGGVLADIAGDIAELIRQDEGLAILAQGLPPLLVEGMDRHGEETELHLDLRWSHSSSLRGISACRPCESRDLYAVPSRSAAAYGSRLFGRDDAECMRLCAAQNRRLTPIRS